MWGIIFDALKYVTVRVLAKHYSGFVQVNSKIQGRFQDFQDQVSVSWRTKKLC